MFKNMGFDFIIGCFGFHLCYIRDRSGSASLQQVYQSLDKRQTVSMPEVQQNISTGWTFRTPYPA